MIALDNTRRLSAAHIALPSTWPLGKTKRSRRIWPSCRRRPGQWRPVFAYLGLAPKIANRPATGSQSTLGCPAHCSPAQRSDRPAGKRPRAGAPITGCGSEPAHRADNNYQRCHLASLCRPVRVAPLAAEAALPAARVLPDGPGKGRGRGLRRALLVYKLPSLLSSGPKLSDAQQVAPGPGHSAVCVCAWKAWPSQERAPGLAGARKHHHKSTSGRGESSKFKFLKTFSGVRFKWTHNKILIGCTQIIVRKAIIIIQAAKRSRPIGRPRAR